MMSDSEQYNGWKNRETWALWLHVSNDQGWYEMVREFVLSLQPTSIEYTYKDSTDYELGEWVVEYVKDTVEELLSQGGSDELRMMRDEIGSWWRIDFEEIGAAARELVSE